MKKLIFYFTILAFFPFAKAKELNIKKTIPSSAQKILHAQNLTSDISAMNINNFTYWIAKDGGYTTQGSRNGTQADFPSFTGGSIYADGFLWGAKVKGDGQGDEVRVGGSTYNRGLKAGRIITDVDGNVLGADEPDNNRVWRVRRDWQTADLVNDARSIFGMNEFESPSQYDIDLLREDYDYAWNNWPAAWGAPYEDVNNDGVYDPNVDIPGYPGADQTIWVVANDVPLIVDANGIVIDIMNTAPNSYGANPIGIELQITLWAYDLNADAPLGNTIFKKASMKYFGLPETLEDALLDSVYFTQWSDPDLGVWNDDYVGCDINSSMGYAYNGNYSDGVFEGIYDMSVPAVGYDFLQGPPDNMDIDGDNDLTEFLGMTSFTYFGAGSSISDPDLEEYSGSLQFYNLMEGFLPRPEYPQQIPWTDPTTGSDTKFALSGDPEYGTGWIDGIQLPPGDRRMVMSSGPYTMKIGDEVDIVLGLIGSVSSNNIESVRSLKLDNELVQLAYDTDYKFLAYDFVVSEPALNMVSVSFVAEFSEEVAAADLGLSIGSNDVVYYSLTPSDSGSFTAEITLAESYQPYNVFLSMDGEDPILLERKIKTWDPIVITDYSVLYDNLSNDGELNPSDIAELGLSVYNNSSLYNVNGLVGTVVDAVGPIDYFDRGTFLIGEVPTNTTATVVYQENPGFHNNIKLKVSDDAQAGDVISLSIRFSSRQLINGVYIPFQWDKQVELTVGDDSQLSDFTEMEHIQGSADGTLGFRVVNPAELNDDTYEVSFYLSGVSGSRSITDVSGTTITGLAVGSQNVGTIDVVFQLTAATTDYNCVQGVELTFGDDIFINSANGATIDGNTVLFGATIPDGAGAFCAGSHELTVNINTPNGFNTSSSSTPFNVTWAAYDDNWAQLWCESNCNTCEAYGIGNACDGTVLSVAANAEGIAVINEYLEYPLNTLIMVLKNLSLDAELLVTDIFPNENSTNFDIIDGFKIFQGSTNYFPAVDYYDITNSDLPCWDPANRPCPPPGAGVTGYYDISSYMQQGWAATAKAVDTWGAGITSPGILGRDIEIRFTGDYDYDNFVTFYDNTGAEVKYILCQEDEFGNCIGGSYAWISGARLYDLADHPDPGNIDQDGSEFRIWVPFEVWDIEDPSGPRQIDIDIYDRKQNFDISGVNEFDPGFMYSFNPYDRMYTHFIHTDYDVSGQYQHPITGDPSGYYTWNVVWWDTQFDVGDEFTFNYHTPVSIEDRYIFTPSSASRAKTSANIPLKYELKQNYPNPFNPFTTIAYSLPKVANVKITVYDILGRQIIKLIDNQMSAGQHSIRWNGVNKTGESVSTGLYYYKIESDNFTKVKKMIMLK